MSEEQDGTIAKILGWTERPISPRKNYWKGNDMLIKWKCEDCGYETSLPIEGVNVLKLDNHYYCAKCVSYIFVDGKAQVRIDSDSPRRGMMRKSLLSEDEQIADTQAN